MARLAQVERQSTVTKRTALYSHSEQKSMSKMHVWCGGKMVGRMVSWHTVGPLMPVKH